MAQTLEEFLINVKYNIDTPSQATFFDAMKKVATSVAGVAGALTGIGIGIMKVSEKMAEAGEKMYWMSQRVGDSVSNIENMSYALSNLGISAGEATAGIERFGAWTRNMGPAATGYLKSLGITATDTIGRMRQLGEYFRTHGGTAANQGTLEYAIALRRWQQMGGDERSMLALSSGQLEESEARGGLIQRLVWGKDWQTGPQQFAAQSVQIMNQFRSMGFFFHNLSQQAGLALFKVIEPELVKINAQLAEMLPHIQAFLNHLISYAPAAMHFLQGVIKAFDWLIQLATVAMETFDKMPGVLQGALAGMLAIGPALRLMGSPIFWVLAGLTALLALLDDYQHWKDDEASGSEVRHSAFDWSALDGPFKAIYEAGGKVNQFIKDLTGIEDGLAKIAALAGGLWAVSRALKAISTAVSIAQMTGGIAGIFKMVSRLVRWGGPIAAAVAAAGAIHEANEPENVAFAKHMFGDDSATSLGKALVARTMADAAGIEPEDWIKRNFPQWLEKTPDGKKLEEFPTQGNYTGLPNPDAKAPGAERSNKLRIFDWWRRLHEDLDTTNPRGGNNWDTRSKNRGTDGSYQLSSAGDDWAVPRGFGSSIDADRDDNRLFDMLRDSLAAITLKLSDILDTLTDMAEGQGAPRTRRGGGDPDDGDMDLLRPGASLEEQEARLRRIEQRESGGRNVNNQTGPGGTAESTASGYYQMIDATWRHSAKLAGVDINRYPRAIDAPWQEQHRAALALINEQGERPWRSSARPNLSHRPLGADGGPGSAPARHPAPDYNNGPAISNNTTISVVAPNPASAAAQVAERQERIFEQHIRFAKGSLLA